MSYTAQIAAEVWQLNAQDKYIAPEPLEVQWPSKSCRWPCSPVAGTHETRLL